jgi:uncharacterized protein YgiM (DUF1202 family)
MKRARGFVVILAAALLCQLSWSSQASASVESRIAEVSVAKGYVRSGPGADYSVVSSLEKGDVVRVLEESGGWYRVSLSGGGWGWISDDIVEVKKVEPTPDAGKILRSLPQGFARSRKGQTVTAAGTRALDEEEEESRAKSRVTDYQSLDLVDRYRILNEQLREFVSEGGLSPEVFP